MRDETDNNTIDLFGDAEPRSTTQQVTSLLPIDIEQPAQPAQPDEQNARACANSASFNELQDTAKAYASKIGSKTQQDGYKPIALHCYTDADGQPIYFKLRLKHPDTGNKWIRAIGPKPDGTGFQTKEPDFKTVYPAGNGKKPLYRLHELVAANSVDPVYIFEGEQKADYGASLGFVATTCGATGSITTTHLEPLTGRTVIIWPDNDTVGLKVRDELTAALQAIGCTVFHIDIDALGLPEKGDIVDWRELRQQAGIDTTATDIEALAVIKCEVLTGSIDDVALPQIANDDQAIEQQIERLAKLPPLTYEQNRKDEAAKLGIRPSMLDKLVNNARKELEATTATDSMFDDVQPYHSPVDGAELLEQIKAIIDRHIVCEPPTSLAAALWIMFTWCIDAVHIAPIACITAPEKRCGKTQLLTLIGELCYKPMPASNITTAALFRSIEKWMPTLLIDEADSFMKENEDLRGIINAGHSRKNAFVIRTTGDNHEPTRFNVFGAKAISGIGHLPETIKDRSIILELRRKQPHETRQRLRHADPVELNIIRSKICRWSIDNMEAISQARPDLPDCLSDRAQDNWEALLAIADLLGGEWGKKSRHAAMAISGDEQQGLSINEELLVDIKTIFDRTGQPRIFTEDLIEHLCSDEDLAWQTWNRGRPITPRQLANRLSDYKIKPKGMRIGSVRLKGYELSDFNDAFIRYLPKTHVLAVTTGQTNDTNAYSNILSVTDSNCVTDKKDLKALQDKGCHVVTHKNSKSGGNATEVII